MLDIYDITGWSQVALFSVWTLAVCALAKALFGSFLIAEIQHRLALRDAPRRHRIGRLSWEVANGATWNEEAMRKPSGVSLHRLSDDILEVKRQELLSLTRTSIVWRATTYLLGCFACQTFWTAVLLYAVTRGIHDPLGWFCSALAYSGAAVILMGVLQRGVEGAPGRDQKRCSKCGGRKS